MKLKQHYLLVLLISVVVIFLAKANFYPLKISSQANQTNQPTLTPTQDITLPLNTCNSNQGCFSVTFWGYYPSSGGTTEVMFKITNHCEEAISYIVVGANGWERIAPEDGSEYLGRLGAYDSTWLGDSSRPDFAGVKFEPKFDGYQSGKSDVLRVLVANFDKQVPIEIQIEGGQQTETVTFDLMSQVCLAQSAPMPTEIIALHLGKDKVSTYDIISQSPTISTTHYSLEAIAVKPLTSSNISIKSSFKHSPIVDPYSQRFSWQQIYWQDAENDLFYDNSHQVQCQLVQEQGSTPIEAYWGQDTSKKYNGSNALWPALTGNAGVDPALNLYPANVNTILRCGPFDFSAVEKVMLRYARWLDIADPDDGLRVGASLDGENFTFLKISGETPKWVHPEMPLLGVAGESEVWIGWGFISDGDTETDLGVWLDDMEVIQ